MKSANKTDLPKLSLTAPIFISDVVVLSQMDGFERLPAGVTLGKCACCGQGLSINMVVTDSKQQTAVVGKDCARKILKLSASEITRSEKQAEDRRQARLDQAKLAEFTQNATAKSLPHPSAKHPTKTLADYASYWIGKDAKSARDALAMITRRVGDAERGVPLDQVWYMLQESLRTTKKALDEMNGMKLLLWQYAEDIAEEGEGRGRQQRRMNDLQVCIDSHKTLIRECFAWAKACMTLEGQLCRMQHWDYWSDMYRCTEDDVTRLAAA